MFVANSHLVDKLNDTVIKKTGGPAASTTKRINFMKDEGKEKAQENYEKLMQ